jgi:hypothetical protein
MLHRFEKRAESVVGREPIVTSGVENMGRLETKLAEMLESMDGAENIFNR